MRVFSQEFTRAPSLDPLPHILPDHYLSRPYRLQAFYSIRKPTRRNRFSVFSLMGTTLAPTSIFPFIYRSNPIIAHSPGSSLWNEALWVDHLKSNLKNIYAIFTDLRNLHRLWRCWLKNLQVFLSICRRSDNVWVWRQPKWVATLDQRKNLGKMTVTFNIGPFHNKS